MSNVGVGLVWTSVDFGRTWIGATSRYTPVIVDAQDAGLVTIAAAGNGGGNTIMFSNRPVGFGIYRNGRRLFRDDATSKDYSYDAHLGIATLKIPVEIDEVFEIDMWIGGGVVTYVYGETPSGVMDGSNRFFTLANTPSTKVAAFTSGGRRVWQGSDFTVSGNQIETVTFVLRPTDKLICDYGH